MKNVMRLPHFGIVWWERELTDLYFADDLVLFTNKSKLMQLMKGWVEYISKKVGFRINVNMSKIQKIGDTEDDVIFLEKPHWKYLKTWYNRMLLTLKKMWKEESPKSLQFSDNFKLFEHPKWFA